MKRRSLCDILVLTLLLIGSQWVGAANTDSIYQGTIIKLDLASPIVVPAATKWQIQHYEVAANVRLAKRFYPTFELGYAGGRTTEGDSVGYNGHGGFFRVGCDINPFKKHPESPHALLVGVRLGTAVQGMRQGRPLELGHPYKVQADCWGEIVAGCQVDIWDCRRARKEGAEDKIIGSLYMGWMGRLKCLFTRQADGVPVESKYAIYIPGFGVRNNIGWGVNYYIGWKL